MYGPGTYNPSPALPTYGPNNPRGRAQLTSDFFIYLANFGNMAAAAAVPLQIQTDADSTFVWVMASVFGFVHGDTAPFTNNIQIPINVLITDGGSSRNLFSAAVPITSFAGDGRQPFILPQPRRFAPHSTINLSAVNNGADQYDQVQLSLIGYKVWKAQ